jgi:transposase, IS30 family
MGKQYDQLELRERIEIYRLHAAGISQAEIARTLARHRSTIGRELKRNARPTKAWPGGYEPVRAQKLAIRRRRWDGRFKLMRQPDLREMVKNRLAMGWSPEQIAGRLTLEHGRTLISHESIYRFVYHRSAQKDYWHRMLPRRKSRRGRLGRRGGSPASRMQRRRPLAERPASAQDRREGGHWEADYMLFSRYGHNVLLLHERSSRLTLALKPPDRRAETTTQHLARMLEPVPSELRKTISFDNGTEFALHYWLTDQLGIDTFFCNTHSPWQKGGIENAIGRMRKALPRKTDLDTVTPECLEQITHAYNTTPRKCLDFKTPAEVFSNLQPPVALQT